VEMRVFVPPSYGGTKEEEQTAAEGFQKLVRETAGIIESSADAICSFSQPDPLFLTPRYGVKRTTYVLCWLCALARMALAVAQ